MDFCNQNKKKTKKNDIVFNNLMILFKYHQI